MIRLSATKIEEYRKWKCDPDDSTEDLTRYLQQTFQPTESMKAGQTFHKVLEQAREGELTIEASEGYTFDFTKLNDTLVLPAIRERKIRRFTRIDGELVSLVGIVDAISPSTIYDHKLTSHIDMERYTHSMQWRCYLDWFGKDKFTYNLFHQYQPTAKPGLYQIKEFMPVTFWRYPALHEDVREMTAGLVSFIKAYVPLLNR